MKKELYIVVATRWRDKKMGNTYHSVIVYKYNGNLYYVGAEPFCYGYEDHYQQTANEIIEAHAGKGYQVLYSVTDVTRKRDLNIVIDTKNIETILHL